MGGFHKKLLTQKICKQPKQEQCRKKKSKVPNSEDSFRLSIILSVNTTLVFRLTEHLGCFPSTSRKAIPAAGAHPCGRALRLRLSPGSPPSPVPSVGASPPMTPSNSLWRFPPRFPLTISSSLDLWPWGAELGLRASGPYRCSQCWGRGYTWGLTTTKALNDFSPLRELTYMHTSMPAKGGARKVSSERRGALPPKAFPHGIQFAACLGLITQVVSKHIRKRWF